MPQNTTTESSTQYVSPVPEVSGSRPGPGELLAIFYAAAAAFFYLCLLSYDPRDPSFNTATEGREVVNACGLVGSYLADACMQILGSASLLIPIGLTLSALAALFFYGRAKTIRSGFWYSLLILPAAVVVQRYGLDPLDKLPADLAGGAVGAFLHGFLLRFLGSAGQLVLLSALLLTILLKLSGISARAGYDALQVMVGAIRTGAVAAAVGLRSLVVTVLSATARGARAVLRRATERQPSEHRAQRSVPCPHTGAGKAGSTGPKPHADSWNPLFDKARSRATPPSTGAVPSVTISRHYDANRTVRPSVSATSPTRPAHSAGSPQTFGGTPISQRKQTGPFLTEQDLMRSIDEYLREMAQRSRPTPPRSAPAQAPSAACASSPAPPARPPVPPPAPAHTARPAVPTPAPVTSVPDEEPTRNVPPVSVPSAESEKAAEEDTALINECVADDSADVEDDEIPVIEGLEDADSDETFECDDAYDDDDLEEDEVADDATDHGRSVIVSKRADEKPQQEGSESATVDQTDEYRLPPIDLLDHPPVTNRMVDQEIMAANAAALEQKLQDLGVKGEVMEIHPGPVITMYELSLATGVPLRKVLNTGDDLAMALKSGSTRIVAPIPGKDTVGIEVPNLNRELVCFREIVESPAFSKSNEPLKMALGKGIDGEPFASSLARMPHLLIAGATGTGKSVGLNCLICSWLMSCHPDDLKLLLIDPKKLELSYYQDIPHLIHPVVTDPDKVPAVLQWALKEMDRRYDLLSAAGAKNVQGYNRKVLNGELNVQDDGTPHEKLPYIVIIVDELAELMMVAAKDIEVAIARLAQMARASGIHMILATQRPSVDVITGLIKANFPARLSFQVSSKADSRTILDTNGAEHLLGRGDLLFLPPGTAKLKRLHGAFISENEIRAIADYVKAQRAPTYFKEISKHVSTEDARSQGAVAIDDEKYDEAVELVTRLGHASISLIQRHMRIGYNRAARIIEAMEAEGLIGPSDGTSRPREVLARSLDSIPDGAA